jgi:hypothetical protein
LHVFAWSSYHTAVDHANIGDTLRTLIALGGDDIGEHLAEFNGQTVTRLFWIRKERTVSGLPNPTVPGN